MLKLILLAIVFTSAISAEAREKEIKSVPGEFIVKLKKPLSATEQMQFFSQIGETSSRMVRADVLVVKKPKAMANGTFLNTFNSSDLVERVEPNYIYSINKLPNDPDFSKLWGLQNSGLSDKDGASGLTGVDVGAEKAWDITTGSKNIVVAVIDTGVDYTHPDLKDNAWTNEAELNGEAGVDDDENGYVDDIHGYDFANNDGDPMDDHSHGTHCSGTIGAKGDDGNGIVGVNWNVSIMGVKFLTGEGSGTLENAIKSIDYATKMKVNIMSNSWGGGGFSETLKESIERAEKEGILFVAAAGNDTNNNDSNPSYPASYEVGNVVSVAALDNRGALAYFSNFGKKTVHVAAPGHNIYSTVAGGGYDTYSGTSMATPHVSGVAALLLSAEPGLTYQDVKERLMKTSKPLAATNNKVAAKGIVDAYFALTNTTPPPDANDPSIWSARQNEALSSVHPYAENHKESFTVKVEGAKRFAIHFSKFETEAGYDKLVITDASGKVVGSLSGDQTDSYSPIIDGDSATLTFSADNMINGYGFDIDYVSYE